MTVTQPYACASCLWTEMIKMVNFYLLCNLSDIYEVIKEGHSRRAPRTRTPDHACSRQPWLQAHGGIRFCFVRLQIKPSPGERGDTRKMRSQFRTHMMEDSRCGPLTLTSLSQAGTISNHVGDGDLDESGLAVPPRPWDTQSPHLYAKWEYPLLTRPSPQTATFITAGEG